MPNFWRRLNWIVIVSVLCGQAGLFNAQAGEPVTLVSFDFVKLIGRPGHQGFFPLESEPMAGASGVPIVANLFGNPNSAEFSLIELDGTLIANLNLNPAADGPEFTGTATVPNIPFKVRVSGLDSMDVAYDLILDDVVAPKSVGLNLYGDSLILGPGSHVYHLDIDNKGAADTFAIEVSDTQGYSSYSGANPVAIGANGTETIMVTVDVPEGVDNFTEISLAVSVQGSTMGSNAKTANTARCIFNRRPQLGTDFKLETSW